MNKLLLSLALSAIIISYLYSQSDEKIKQADNLKKKYSGELSIQWDNKSGGPKRILGNNIYLKSRSVNKANVHKLSHDFVEEHRDFLNFNGTELNLENIAELNNKYILAYQQI